MGRRQIYVKRRMKEKSIGISPQLERMLAMENSANSSLSRVASALEHLYGTLDTIADILQVEASCDLSFEEARRELFHSKSREWIRFYIVDRHPEILTSRGGWLTDSHGKGSRVIVTDSLRAKLWIMQATDIDWSAPEPKSLAV